MKDSIFHKFNLKTPAYVYDADKIINVLEIMNKIQEDSSCFLLYSIKSANNIGLLELIRPYVNGFSCSSMFELQLAKEILDSKQTVHISTPGFNKNELNKLSTLSDFITLNSITQLNNFSDEIKTKSSCGIRINPELSFVSDARFDPCRSFSKLGIPLTYLNEDKNFNSIDWSVIDGIHVHNNCESINFDEMRQTISKIMLVLKQHQIELKWFNLGGGYLIDSGNDFLPLVDTIRWLQDNFSVDVYFEPGKAVTGNAGYLIASVIDLFRNGGEQIAILDASINHLPEVFEYQYQPKVMYSQDITDYKYHLAGSSCLSGDLFGEYCFEGPLELGSLVVFENVGAYMQVKANMFNGINLPSIYLLDENSNFRLLKEYDYNSFRDRL